MIPANTQKLTREVQAFLQSEGLEAETLGQLEELIAQYREKPGGLIPALHGAQRIVGYLPPPLQKYIAVGLNVPPSEVFGVVSFYSSFTMVPRGKHVVTVCVGTTCHLSGRDRICKFLQRELGVAIGETTPDRMVTLLGVQCLAACGRGPIMVVDGEYYENMNPPRASSVLRRVLASAN